MSLYEEMLLVSAMKCVAEVLYYKFNVTMKNSIPRHITLIDGVMNLKNKCKWGENK